MRTSFLITHPVSHPEKARGAFTPSHSEEHAARFYISGRSRPTRPWGLGPVTPSSGSQSLQPRPETGLFAVSFVAVDGPDLRGLVIEADRLPEELLGGLCVAGLNGLEIASLNRMQTGLDDPILV